MSARPVCVPVTMDLIRRRKREGGNEPGSWKRRPPSVGETCRGSRDPPKDCRARERHDDLRGEAGDEQVLVDEIRERRASCDALHDLLGGERARLHDRESHREREPTVRLLIPPREDAADRRRGRAREREDQRQLGCRGKVVVTGMREDEVTVMRIGYRQDVRQRVTEHEAGDREREHCGAAEPACGCGVAHGSSR